MIHKLAKWMLSIGFVLIITAYVFRESWFAGSPLVVGLVVLFVGLNALLGVFNGKR